MVLSCRVMIQSDGAVWTGVALRLEGSPDHARRGGAKRQAAEALVPHLVAAEAAGDQGVGAVRRVKRSRPVTFSAA